MNARTTGIWDKMSSCMAFHNVSPFWSLIGRFKPGLEAQLNQCDVCHDLDMSTRDWNGRAPNAAISPQMMSSNKTNIDI